MYGSEQPTGAHTYYNRGGGRIDPKFFQLFFKKPLTRKAFRDIIEVPILCAPARPCITGCNLGRPRLYNLMLWDLTKLPQYVVFLGRIKNHMLWLGGPWKAAKPESKKASALQAKTEICICTQAKTGFAFCILIQFAICTLAFSGRAGPVVRRLEFVPSFFRQPENHHEIIMKS